MNKANGVSHIEYNALVYAITHLEGYKVGRSSMQEYYFPIKNLSQAINATDNYVEEFVEEEGLTL